MPEKDFKEFQIAVKNTHAKGFSYCGIDSFNNNLFYCSCLTRSFDSFPDIEINIGSNNYKVPSTSYIDHKNLKCYFKI